MNILGIGTVCARGFDIASLAVALEEGWRPPGEVDGRPVYKVDLENAPDRSLLKKLRRADRLSRMAVLAAAGAVADSGLSLDGRRVGILLATPFGPHVTTFDFLDGILDFGEANVSPTAFSHSVHNAAASYVAVALEIKGPTLTVSRFRHSFASALQLAACWLAQDRVDLVLAGGADIYGPVLGHVAGRLLPSAPDGAIAPFVLSPVGQVPGEGAAFFLLGRGVEGQGYGRIGPVAAGRSGLQGEAADLDILAADGMRPDESAYRSLLVPGRPVAAYAPLFGSTMVNPAFQTAVAALSVRRQTVFPSPVTTNPHGLPLAVASPTRPLRAVRCLDLACGDDPSSILVNAG
jgi:3-oxoacyl-[acyl-carrier-protein] synthase II